MPPHRRAIIGFLAGATWVLPFYQGLWTTCAQAGLNLQPYPSGGIPLLLLLCAAGGVFGAILASCGRRLRGPSWFLGTLLGMAISVLLWFVLAPLTGAPVAGGWQPVPMLQTLTIHAAWGFALGLTLPMVLARTTQRSIAGSQTD